MPLWMKYTGGRRVDRVPREVFSGKRGILCQRRNILSCMRLFVAIALPSDLAEELARGARQAIPPAASGRIRWQQPADLHLTLSFLGHAEKAQLEKIRGKLKSLRAAPLKLDLAGVGSFVKSGVVLVTVERSPALVKLAESVVQGMEECGFPREDRPYVPHITLARSKGRISFAPTAASQSVFRRSFEAGSFRLYESITAPDGARYDVLEEFPLA